MRFFNLPKKVVNYIRKSIYIKQFKKYARSSGFGSDGLGKKCVIVGKNNISIGENTWIDDGCELIAYNSHFEQKLYANLCIGDNVRIHKRCRITCAGEIVIENNVLMAPEVFITDHNHGMAPEYLGGYSPQPLLVKDVRIENGVWLGQRVTILPGVTVGKHSIIGANSVVTRSVPEYCIAVGNPAKVIKHWNFETKEWEKV